MSNLDLTWTGLRTRQETARVRVALVAGLAAVALALVPLDPATLHVAVVALPTLVALAAAALPRRWNAFWQIGPGGIDTRVGRRRRHLPPDEIVSAELAERESGPHFVVRDAENVVAQEAPLHHVGAPLTALLVARAAGLPVTAPSYVLPLLRRQEAAVLEATMTGVANAAPAADRVEEFVDPEVRGPATELVLRLVFGGAGLLSVGLLAAGPGTTWIGRVVVALGVLLAVTLLPGLRRGRDVAAVNRWRFGPTLLQVTDRHAGRREFAVADVGAAVPLTGTVLSAEGKAVPGPVVLLVDRSTAPLAELPLRSHDAVVILRALRRRGVPTVDLDTVPDEDDTELVTDPLVPEVPNGRLVVDRAGAHWLDADGFGFTLADAAGLHLIEIVTVEGRPWAVLHGVSPDDAPGTPGRVLVTAALMALRITREDLRSAAVEAGYELRDPEADAWRRAAQRTASLVASPAAVSLGRRLPDGTTVLKDRVMQRFTRGGGLAVAIFIGCGLLARVLVMADDGAPVGWIAATAVVGALVAAVMSFRGERVVVSAVQIEFRRRFGKVAWVVDRGETSGVVSRLDGEHRRVAFYDAHGALLRDVQFPGPGRRVDAALADWGWPLGRPVAAAPPAQI